MEGDIGTWISGIPVVTRYWFFSFFFLPLTTRLGLIDPRNLILFSDKVISNFQVRERHVVAGRSSVVLCNLSYLFPVLQIWRLVTALLWHPVNFNWLMMLYFLYSYSRLLEEGT